MTDIKSDFSIGDRVRLLADIWDDGEDHHPPGYLARKGEVLIIRKLDPGAELPLCVSHEHITDRSFEDNSFKRDWSWVKTELLAAYEQGRKDANEK